jgi:integrase
LRWSDVDLKNGALAIAKARVSTERGVMDSSPKSGHGRAVAVDAGTVAILRTHRKRQAAEKLALGPGYLRHGWASLALAAGVNPKVVSERLGHATVGFTLDRYSHVLPGLQEDAAAKVAALVGLK